MVKLKKQQNKQNSVEAYLCSCMLVVFATCTCNCNCDCMNEFTKNAGDVGERDGNDSSQNHHINYSSEGQYAL